MLLSITFGAILEKFGQKTRSSLLSSYYLTNLGEVFFLYSQTIINSALNILAPFGLNGGAKRQSRSHEPFDFASPATTPLPRYAASPYGPERTMNATHLLSGNLFSNIQSDAAEESFFDLLRGDGLLIERIVSRGHRSPDGFWYDQPWNEWVLILKGAARLEIEGQDRPILLSEGDYCLLPSHVRHRVTWTPEDCETIWLAVHYADQGVSRSYEKR
jgi:cupin 2 domain-containing protein